MRLTLTIDGRIVSRLRVMAHRSGKPLEVVVNETLQAGLVASQEQKVPKRYRLTPVSLGGIREGIDLDRSLALADVLEDEELTRKIERHSR